MFLFLFRRTRRQDIRNGDPLSQCSDLQHHGTSTHTNTHSLSHTHAHLCHSHSNFSSLSLGPAADDVDGLGGSVEDRSVYGVENSSMFLECSPKSQRALIYWQLQRPNDERKHEVRTARKRTGRTIKKKHNTTQHNSSAKTLLLFSAKSTVCVDVWLG